VDPSKVTDTVNLLPVSVTQSYSDSDLPPAGTTFFYRVRGTGCFGPATCSSQADCGLATEGFCSSAGPFGVPGRSRNGTFPVTLSEATLTSSLVTFFSPPTIVFQAASSSNAGGVSQTLTNGGTNDITVTTPASPPGCCADDEDSHQIRCDDVCVHYLTDPQNCGSCGNMCGPDALCENGSCVNPCDEGEAYCDGLCVTLGGDNANCGSCGHACSDGECCSGGECTPPCDPGRALCAGDCVDTKSDGTNCGSCGNDCGDNSCCDGGGCTPYVCGVGETSCPGGCTDILSDPNNCGGCGIVCDGCCNDGECSIECGTQSSPHPGTCPNPSVPPLEAVCDPNAVSGGHPSAHVFPIPPPSTGDAPVCITPETTVTIHPGATVTTCTPGGPLFKEAAGSILVCGDAIPGVHGRCTIGTTGTFNQLIADPTIAVGDAFVTPFAVHVLSDTSNDGMLQPGEQGTVSIDVLNAGPLDITSATATLSGPTVDLTDDEIVNPVGITVGGGAVAYGTILGTPLSTNCTAPTRHPATGTPAFPVTVPANHPGDTIRPMVLSVAGTVNGRPFTGNVPLGLGIGSSCNAAAHTRSFDGLDGLSNPMAKLVPTGDPVPFPSNSFSGGSTRPLRLRMYCGGVNLTDSAIDPPQIVGISEATRGPLDIASLNLNSDNSANPDDPYFRFNNTIIAGGQWTYNMRTSALGTGTFTLTIRIGGRKDYVTGFKLR
jgi:hypothetical protein